MIKAEGLRLGNAIEFNFKVTEWSKVEMSVNDFKHIEKHKELYRPILLTEEVYIKFGYECLQELITDMIHESKHPISNNVGLWAATISGLKVHELQNLFFWITSNELTFK